MAQYYMYIILICLHHITESTGDEEEQSVANAIEICLAMFQDVGNIIWITCLDPSMFDCSLTWLGLRHSVSSYGVDNCL